MVFWKRSTPKTETVRAARPAATKTTPVAERTPEKPKSPAHDAKQQEVPKSFDPYNSGAFDRRDTWGKVIRK